MPYTLRHYEVNVVQWNLVKSPRGVGFLFHFSDEASPNKNPTYDFHFLSDFFQIVNNGERTSTFYWESIETTKISAVNNVDL